MNRMKTAMLLAALTALLLWAGQALGGQGGFLLALILAGAMNFGAYWWSDKIVLINPFSGGGLLRLFSTHPPTKARVERLVAMARQGLTSRA